MVGPPPNKYLPRIGPVSSSGTESQRTVEFSNSSIIIGFFISRIALEPGTHISARVPTANQIRYRGKRVSPTQNSLCAFYFHMSFTYVMVGWGGTANDSRIFLKTITEPENGHYRHRENTILWTKAIRLCLAFFLLTVGSGTTCVKLEKAVSGPQERFNYLHSSLRNVIERCFGVPFSYSQGHALFLVEAEVHCTCLLCYPQLD